MRTRNMRHCIFLITVGSFTLLMQPSQPLRAVQQLTSQPTTTVMIDGSKDPDKIPDWILWREIFRISALLSEKAKDHGDEIWLKRVGMRKKEKDKFLARAFTHRDDDADFDKRAKAIVDKAGTNISEDNKRKLKDLQEDKKKMILDHRDKLKDEIGDELHDRLTSWARLHIAPGLKVGNLSTNAPGPGAVAFGHAGKR